MGLDYSTGSYPLFFGGFENQCQTYNVYGAELGVRTFPVEGLDVYANYTLMKVNAGQRPAARRSSSRSSRPTRARARTSSTPASSSARRPASMRELDFHYVSPQNWAEQVSDVQKQQIVYQSFHLTAYALLNARVGYRFLGTTRPRSAASPSTCSTTSTASTPSDRSSAGG